MRNRWFLASLCAAMAALSQPIVSAQSAAVKVHGHWTIDIRQPDGTLAAHHEFDNALSSNGQLKLAAVLTRNHTVLSWVVHLRGVDASSEPCLAAETPVLCSVDDMTVSTDDEGSSVILNGFVTAQRDGLVASVATRLVTCSSPLVCLSGGDFTAHTLLKPVPVTAGQIIQVRVAISFS
jgi:hypothetical protein